MSLLIANQTAYVDYDGKRVKIVKGHTVVHPEHPIVQYNEHLFNPLEVHYNVAPPVVEEATAAPGKVRKVNLPPVPKSVLPKPDPEPESEE